MTDCQRWRERRESYRPAREVIRTSEFDVASIDSDTPAREFVELHHYSGSFPAAVKRFGLYRFGALVGVTVFSYPTNDLALTNIFPALKPGTESVELGRLVLLDEVGANAETFFVARCFEHLRAAGFRGVRSDSDPVARTSIDGRTVTPGHVGTVYQALNARYLGLGTPRTLYLLPDGTALNARTMQKIRKQEKGWQGAVATLEALGAPAFDGEPREWLRRTVAAITRRMRHPGNHRYAWALDRRVQLPTQTARYPKKAAA